MQTLQDVVFDLEELALKTKAVNCTMQAVLPDLTSQMDEDNEAIFYGLSINLYSLTEQINKLFEDGMDVISSNYKEEVNGYADKS